MKPQTKIITHELLRSLSPCVEGYKRFCELFPDGADLQTAIDGLVADEHDDWAEWLFDRCRENDLSKDVVVLGYRNSGYRNSGNRNSGDWNSGNRNSGNWNSGDRNSGYRNSGDWNSGDWNSGNWNSGYLNTVTPDEILVFNKPCKRSVWEDAYKPDFMSFDLAYWVSESEMTDADKIADLHFHVRGGQLRTRTFKEAWKHAWDNADPVDRMRVKELPNFDADVFFEISGIDLRGDPV